MLKLPASSGHRRPIGKIAGFAGGIWPDFRRVPFWRRATPGNGLDFGRLNR